MRPLPAHPVPRVATPRSAIAQPPAPSLAGACTVLAATAVLQAAVTSILVSHGGMGWPVVPLALALFLPVCVFVVRHLGDHPYARFGPANIVTVARGGMAAAIGACAIQYGDLSEAGGTLQWGLVGAALFALSLDGVDGWLARRTGLASRFGERLDMEVDAFLILILCVLDFADGKAGAYVFAIGLMRYGFLAWGAFDPRLARPLAPSLRRKKVCVLQIALLCAALLPPVAPPVSEGLAILALLLLAWSFAIDIRTLLQAPA